MLLLLALACTGTSDAPSPASTAKPTAGAVQLDISYGSEKKAWMEAMITRFQDSGPKLADGRAVVVKAISEGSGDSMRAILEGREKPDVYSPASSAYLTLLDHLWVASHPAQLTTSADPLLLSPVVIALWRPMAEALGWPDKKLGWSDLLKIHADPKGWGSVGHPEWGRFRFGHTHPGQSNSGLLGVLAEVYAGAGKSRGLELADLQDPKIRDYVSNVEGAIVHYGKSTNYFADKMRSRGPEFLSAAVLYESSVIDSYQNATPGALPLVSIYPVEGTFWSDHPYAVLDADWVKPDDKEAAALFGAFLKARPQQEAALGFGFRPADPGIPVGAPIDAAHGADPKEPQNLLEVPGGAVLDGLLTLWEQTKRAADVRLVFDKSGSMKGRPIEEARNGAKLFLETLGDKDRVSLAFFDNQVYPPKPPVLLGTDRVALIGSVMGTMPGGGTALYDAIDAAWKEANSAAQADDKRIHALVVMTDGRDENSTLKLESLRDHIKAGEGERRVVMFTIGYGDNVDTDVLSGIAEAATGAFTKGNPDNIRSVFQDMAAYF